ncbi:MAG: Uma2 family endonuclease [Anaerolineae bacterium]|nr:Uma2 family endonuclease [Anaerolineae bacterium]MBN8620018.1 Uma2 family endonuclease [Anaerolineae bacterium]
MFVQKQMTPEEFLVFADQHPDKRFDFIDGEIVEVSPKPIHGRKQTLFAVALEAYTAQNPIGLVYTEVLHVLDGEKFMPDVCINVESEADYLTTPPVFAVEVRSDSQSRESQRRKMRAYIQHGVKMGVLVLPGEAVEVYEPGKETQVLTVHDTLDGGDVLPGFILPLNRILP